MREGEGYARCPGCRDLGDVAHVAACCAMLAERQARASWHAGGGFAIAVVRKQLARRGVVDEVALGRALEYRGRPHARSARFAR